MLIFCKSYLSFIINFLSIKKIWLHQNIRLNHIFHVSFMPNKNINQSSNNQINQIISLCQYDKVLIPSSSIYCLSSKHDKTISLNLNFNCWDLHCIPLILGLICFLSKSIFSYSPCTSFLTTFLLISLPLFNFFWSSSLSSSFMY